MNLGVSARRRVTCAIFLLGLALPLLLPAVARGQTPDDRPTGGADPTSGPEIPAPDPTSPLPSHDWRAVGFAAVVEGTLYDPHCRPLRSVGSNLPNLMFRRGLRENLEWMRWHQMRWLRVVATGHGHATPHPEAQPGAVERRLGELLRTVEAFNAEHSPEESIYVLVSFTDYYEPGVPGDRYGFDKEGWCLLRVLNGPWYRRGVSRYSFREVCGDGRLDDAPNYEVHYKPWVERLVRVGARSPALLGWQLGNEMKAKNSALNGITEAHDWYLDWMQDMVDTIRAIDRSHLIFAGAQYMAELTDLPYRPTDAEISVDGRARYLELFDRMLRACAAYCWNAWSLTNYDFRLYAIDDAMLLQQAGVAAVVTEHGFTLGTPREEQERYGGDRLAAVRSGLDRPWPDLDGTWRPRHWGVAELVEQTGLDGVAPWGSPNPDPGADPWLDLDHARGISHAPEGSAFWHAWRETAARLEDANRRAGISAACLAYESQR